MRCPHCRHRALGPVAWLGHSFNQPIWKTDRYHLTCGKCETRLAPAPWEKTASFVMMAAGTSVAVGARLMLPPPRPHAILFSVIGVLIGLLVHYPFARYKPVDPAVVSNLPTVRKVE